MELKRRMPLNIDRKTYREPCDGWPKFRLGEITSPVRNLAQTISERANRRARLMKKPVLHILW